VTAYVTAPSIAWGPGAVEQLSALGSKRAFVIVDPAVADRAPRIRIVEELERSGTVVEQATAGERPSAITAVGELAARLRRFDPDWVVAVGGGATLDGAKAARLWAELPDLPLDPVPALVPFPEAPRMRVVAIPTTSGSGAEASWTCDLVSADGRPVEIAHRALVPEWALVDPAFADGLDARGRLAGGFEAVGLAAEAFVSAWANPFSDALALGALREVVTHLPLGLRWTDEPDARAALHYAATLAGLASSNAQRGLAHALARALVRPTGLAYGLLLGIALPSVLEFDRPGAREKLDLLAQAATPAGEPNRTDLATRLRRLADTLGAPPDLRAAGVAADALASERTRIVAETLGSPGAGANPRVPTPEEVGELLDRLLGVRPRGGGPSA
jgi:alcohol dehydrogenase class IV